MNNSHFQFSEFNQEFKLRKVQMKCRKQEYGESFIRHLRMNVGSLFRFASGLRWYENGIINSEKILESSHVHILLAVYDGLHEAKPDDVHLDGYAKRNLARDNLFYDEMKFESPLFVCKTLTCGVVCNILFSIPVIDIFEE